MAKKCDWEVGIRRSRLARRDVTVRRHILTSKRGRRQGQRRTSKQTWTNLDYRRIKAADLNQNDDYVLQNGVNSVFMYPQNSHCSLYLAASLAVFSLTSKGKASTCNQPNDETTQVLYTVPSKSMLGAWILETQALYPLDSNFQLYHKNKALSQYEIAGLASTIRL